MTADSSVKNAVCSHSLGFNPSNVSDIVFLKNNMKNSVLVSNNDIISIDYSDIARMVAKNA